MTKKKQSRLCFVRSNGVWKQHCSSKAIDEGLKYWQYVTSAMELFVEVAYERPLITSRVKQRRTDEE